MKSGPTFCWECNRRLMLATTGEHKGRYVWSVVTDPDGREHRVHKQCADLPGSYFVREEVDLEMKPRKLMAF